MSQVITQTEANDKTLLTYSALNTFRNCPRKYKNRYLDNLRPRERAEALSFGSVIHTAIELWYRSPDTESRLPDVLAYIDDAFENRVVDSNQMVQWHLATAMIRGYAERYATEEFEIVEVEKEFVGEIRNPDTGRQSQTFRIAGKVDGIVHETGKPKHAATHKKLRAKDRPLANDFVSDEAFDQLLEDWFGNIARVLLPGRCFYIWGGYANCGNYPPVLKKHGLYFSQSIIWDKQHPVLTRKDFMGAHEWAFYGWKEGAGHKYYGPKNATDLWQVKKINPQSMSHLTQKPVELAVRAMQYSSVQGENVLDLFGGSGSTLIGAEQCGRNAFLMELDTLYCDVIVDRFQRFTGIPAVLERTGESPIPMKAREENMR